MKFSGERVKSEILLAISVLAVLFTICLVLYSDAFPKNGNVDINTNVTIKGGNDELSLNLQKMIPYDEVNNTKYKTAYQDKEVNIKDISNDILLGVVYNNLKNDEVFNNKKVFEYLSNIYGTDLFIINNSFNINGKYSCDYVKDTYNCDTLNESGIIYKTIRNITDTKVSDITVLIDENILFYSIEEKDGITYYKIYSDGTYQNTLNEFTSLDIESKKNVLEDASKMKKYRSFFKRNENSYIWLKTNPK